MDIMPSPSMPPLIVEKSSPIVAKPSYKNIMADLMKPLIKDDSKPNIHLGGGQFSKLDKI
jgi:hypothetical protein